MLSTSQRERVWTRVYESEVRAYYFGELTRRCATRKRVIDALLFCLASGVMVGIVAGWRWWPMACATIAAVLAAYSIAASPGHRLRVLAKLYREWNEIHADCERLWRHQDADDAELVLVGITKRAADASDFAIIETAARYDEELLRKWEESFVSPIHEQATGRPKTLLTNLSPSA